MTAIVPLSTAIFSNRLAVNLPRYSQIVDYAEPAFFGVAHPVNKEYACREVWSHDQRIAVYRALQNAQSKVDSVAEYPLLPTWIGPERHPLGNPIVLKYGQLIQLGQKAITAYAGQTVDDATDPAIITVTGGAVADVNEIHVYHPGTHVEIYPSDIVNLGADLVISIPLVRMVAIAFENTPAGGLQYPAALPMVTPWYEVTVDVEREYLSPTLPAVQYVSYGCGEACTCPDPTLYDGCGYVLNSEMSIISAATLGCVCIPGDTRFVDVYYQAGLTSLTSESEDILVRLAHALMPNEPCGCDFLKGRWRGDQKVPEILTAERENCPWGMSNGAWQGYVFAQSIKQHRMGVI
jgi:hypothetical protein